jgi:hypothetical protein
MKLSIAMGLVALSMIALGGCSSMQSKDQAVAARGIDIDDADYVDRVDRLARERGVAVHWVNPPTKHVSGSL